ERQGGSDLGLGPDLGEVPRAAKVAVRHARRAAGALRQDAGALAVQVQMEEARRALQDADQVLRGVPVELLEEAEPRAERVAQHALPRGGPDQRELLEG